MNRPVNPGADDIRAASALPVFSDSARRLGIGIAGTGHIVRQAHLPAYDKHGFRVVGVYDIAEAAVREAQRRFDVGKVYASLDELIADPDVTVVDVATRPEDRVPLMRAALEAGKNVLGQKPFAPTLAEAAEIAELADRVGRVAAVNVNGRWAPHWRAVSTLIERGVLGQPLAVTHLYDTSFGWTVSTHFNEMPHFGLYDYSVHWIDIGLRWLRPSPVRRVQAREWRLPSQPPESRTPWGLEVSVELAEGTTMGIRGVCGSASGRQSHPFVVHGTEATLRGSVLDDSPLWLDRGGESTALELRGSWFPDGFAGSMGEVLEAVVVGREPDNSARDGLRTLSVVLGAVASAQAGGLPVTID